MMNRQVLAIFCANFQKINDTQQLMGISYYLYYGESISMFCAMRLHVLCFGTHSFFTDQLIDLRH